MPTVGSLSAFRGNDAWTGGRACIGTLMGDPLIGGMTLLGNGLKVVSRGKIALAKQAR